MEIGDTGRVWKWSTDEVMRYRKTHGNDRSYWSSWREGRGVGGLWKVNLFIGVTLSNVHESGVAGVDSPPSALQRTKNESIF